MRLAQLRYGIRRLGSSCSVRRFLDEMAAELNSLLVLGATGVIGPYIIKPLIYHHHKGYKSLASTCQVSFQQRKMRDMDTIRMRCTQHVQY